MLKIYIAKPRGKTKSKKSKTKKPIVKVDEH